jgi:enoyl-[acyl-carrier protein] reductase I
MGLFDGKKGLILGVANDRSLAWAIAEFAMQQGAVCGFSHLPDKADDEKKKNRLRVSKCTDKYPNNAKILGPMDVQKDDDIRAIMDAAAKEYGKIDFLVHAIAYAKLDDLKVDTIQTSRDGFNLAMEISAYSLIAVSNAAKDILVDNGSILTLTYFGGEKAVPGYNVMGICKAALDSIVKYLAYDLGPRGIRVNAVSAGPVRTLAGSAAGVDDMQRLYEKMAPLGRNITHEEVGKTGGFLLSDLSGGITGEILHLDGGYNIMGSPGRLLDAAKDLGAK